MRFTFNGNNNKQGQIDIQNYNKNGDSFMIMTDNCIASFTYHGLFLSHLSFMFN